VYNAHIQHCSGLQNTAFTLLQLFQSENVYIVLVGIEVWTNGDLINVNASDSPGTLMEFCVYRRNKINPYHNNDHAQLLSYVSPRFPVKIIIF